MRIVVNEGFVDKHGNLVKEPPREVEVPNDWFAAMTRMLIAPSNNGPLYVSPVMFDALLAEMDAAGIAHPTPSKDTK